MTNAIVLEAPRTALDLAPAGKLATAKKLAAAKELVIDGLNSQHSKRAYGVALDNFFSWWTGAGQPQLNKAVVNQYKASLITEDLAPATINLRISAVRRLAREAADNGILDPVLAEGIARAKGVKTAGVRAGNWLDKAQALDLLKAPDTDTLKGLRDRAALAVMIGCGLRRGEVAALTYEHIQQRDSRWAIVDIVGKGGRVRTVPMPSWAKVAIDEYRQRAGLEESGPVFKRINKGDNLAGDSMTPQAVADIVKTYDGTIAAHDLRRTFAKLADKGGASLAQIQLNLGHASLKTTQRYLGSELDLNNAPCDVLGLGLE